MMLSRFLASFAGDALTVAIGWELYERTGDALALGLVGLVQIIPVILLALPAGHAADQYNRRLIVIAGGLMSGVGALGLFALSVGQGPIWLVYAFLLLVGIAHGLNGPATAALQALTVPPHAYKNMATWNSTNWQLAVVLGPAIGGLLIALAKAAAPVYALTAAMFFISSALVVLIRVTETARPKSGKAPLTLKTLTSGLSFIWRDKIILSAITLDMFAVLLGGATALLPVFAKDILLVGPEGLGVLRAAPSIGALAMAIGQAYRTPYRDAGPALLWSVIGFGAATIVFGLSTSFWLSLAMLFALGALDNISVVIRHTLILTHTPDDMRGRVSAVNSVFIGMSNELGAFESGVAARLLGTVGAVVFGGVGTILVVIAVAAIWPEIRALKKLDDPLTPQNEAQPAPAGAAD
jgi:MFS family permease